jgi:DnaJ-domain-containing protein 1
MPRKFSESEVDKIQVTLTSIVDSFMHNGYSPESVAEAFIREGYYVRDAIDDVKSKRSKHHGRDSGYSSSNSSYGRDSGYSSSNSSRKGSRGYRAHEYRPGGYADSSYTAPPPSGTKPEEDPYKVLGISKTATAEQIKSTHRKLCMKYHSDRVKGTHEKKAATEHMARINQANDVLKDEKLRAYYDRTGLISPDF